MNRKGIFLIAFVVLFGLVLAFWLRSAQPGTVENGGQAVSSAGNGVGGAASSRIAATRELSCDDGMDNEGDNLQDCDDPDCAGVAACRCEAFSCGGEGGNTCRPEDGCICSSGNCMACRSKDQTCETSADCCAGLALECQQVTLATGALEKRCMPLSRSICNIRCEGTIGTQGIWSDPYGCSAGTAPDTVDDCGDLVGACDVAPIADRNVRRCWQS